jgi:hypothetical protein
MIYQSKNLKKLEPIFFKWICYKNSSNSTFEKLNILISVLNYFLEK